MGEFSTEAYAAYEIDLHDDGHLVEIPNMRQYGTYFLMTFLLVNMIIMLNFVIAILGNTFEKFNDQA